MKKKIIGIFVCVCLIAALGVAGLTSEAAKTKDKSTNNKTTEQKKETKEIQKNTSVSTKSNTQKKETEVKKETKKEAKKETKTEVKKTETKKVAADGKVDDDDFIIIINDIQIKFGEDFNLYTDKIGEPDDYTQARSCMHDGDDKIYTFGDVIVYTFPEGKKDIVYIVEYTGDTPTLSGIKAGSTKAEVISAYGNDFVEDPMFLTYETKEGATVSFQMENDIVTYIELFKE